MVTEAGHISELSFTKRHPIACPNTPVTPTDKKETNKNHQIRGEIGLQSVLIRFVGLCSGTQI